MTISKTQLDQFIEREVREHAPYGTYQRESYREGAQLLAPLLLQAVGSMQEVVPQLIKMLEQGDDSELSQWTNEIYDMRKALCQIEATVKGGTK